MSDTMPDETAPEPTPPARTFPRRELPQERVLLGLLLSLVAVLGGVVLAVAIWRAGYIAGISSLVISGGGVALYRFGAGTPPRRGLIPLIGLVVLGVVASFFAVVGSDLYDLWDLLAGPSADSAYSVPSRGAFIRDNITNGDVLSEYGTDGALFALFALVGVYGTLRRLVTDR
jgi:hypothetical protein